MKDSSHKLALAQQIRAEDEKTISKLRKEKDKALRAEKLSKKKVHKCHNARTDHALPLCDAHALILPAYFVVYATYRSLKHKSWWNCLEQSCKG